jgi:hypothetical protein
MYGVSLIHRPAALCGLSPGTQREYAEWGMQDRWSGQGHPLKKSNPSLFACTYDVLHDVE